MKYTTDLIDAVMTSDSGKNALDYISPVYGNAENFLKILNAIGTELDEAVGWGYELEKELSPETSTWLIECWEMEYGIPSDPNKSNAERRAQISSRVGARTAMNPSILAKKIKALTGVNARIEECVSKNKFRVYLQATTSATESSMRALVNRVKPAHLIFEILYEQYLSAVQYQASVITYFGNVTIRQAY